MSFSTDKPLPPLTGPKLQPFSQAASDVEFLNLLSEATPGRHSHVFEVMIESKRYALKVFKFFDEDEGLELFDTYDIPRDILILQVDPFYAECRAYGRIEENKQNGKLAVRCYGFTAIPAEREEEFRARFEIYDWDRPAEEYEQEPSQRQSFRAIVKDLVQDTVAFTSGIVKRMKKDLMALRRIYVYVRDVRADNYKGGKLVDFSSAWTAPHTLLSNLVRDEDSIQSDIQWDLEQFDDMVRESGVRTKVRASRNEEYCQKLRSHSKPKGK